MTSNYYSAVRLLIESLPAVLQDARMRGGESKFQTTVTRYLRHNRISLNGMVAETLRMDFVSNLNKQYLDSTHCDVNI